MYDSQCKYFEGKKLAGYFHFDGTDFIKQYSLLGIDLEMFND